MKVKYILLPLFLLFTSTLFSQVTYPKIVAFAGVVHTIVTISNDNPSYNFKNYYQVGFPTGINVWKSAKIGYSLQFIPVIRTEKGVSKMSNFIFHPGVLVALGNGFTFAGRIAFESSGRFGFTPVFSKIVVKGKYSNIYVGIPLPVRLGNDKPLTFSPSVEAGFTF